MAKGTAAFHRGWYELALYTAWHVAAFNSQTKSKTGLKPWGQIRAKLLGVEEQHVPVSGMQRKAERQRQMSEFRKHQEQRKRPVIKRG